MESNSEGPPENVGADVGILAADENHGMDSGIVGGHNDLPSVPMPMIGSGIQTVSCDDSKASSKEEEQPSEPAGPTTRWDVFQALKQVTIPGNFCAGGCADGSITITPSLPAAVGLRIASSKSKSKATKPAPTSIGTLPLPISDHHIQQLRKLSWKVDDESYHNVRQVDPECIKITNPSWEASLTKLLRTASLQLGVNPGHVRADLDMMLLFQRGSCVDRCRNADEDDNVLGSLMIQLPSAFTGGEIHIWDNNDEKECNKNTNRDVDDNASSDDEDDSLVQSFDLGSGARSTAPFSCHYLCHYSDCDYEMKKIKSGTRLMLLYSLIHDGNGTKPTARKRLSEMSLLETSLNMLRRTDRILAYPFAKEYSATHLAAVGIRNLSVRHRGKVEAIRAAGKFGWKIMVIYATRTDTEKRQYGGYHNGYREEVIRSTSRVSLDRVVNENGNDLVGTKNWLSRILCLDPCEGNGNGMVLAHAPSTPSDDHSYDSEYYGYSHEFVPEHSVPDVWGNGKEEVEEDDDHYGYSYGAPEKTVTITYSSSFLLAYDESCEIEMKCLAGGAALASAAKEVSSAEDLDLLERLLSVLKSNSKSILSDKSCWRLLRMVLYGSVGASLSKSKKSELVNAIFDSRDSQRDPSGSLFRTIHSAVKMVGWAALSDAVQSIMKNGARLQLSALQFTSRIGFLLKLRSVEEFKCFEDDPAQPNLTEDCFNDFLSSQCKTRDFDMSALSSAVEEIVERNRWSTLVYRVLDVCTGAMMLYQQSCYVAGYHGGQINLNGRIDIAGLLLKLKQKASGEVIQKLDNRLGSFVSDFSLKLGETMSSGRPQNAFFLDESDKFITLLRLILTHGKGDEFNAFGSWATDSESRFSSIVKRIMKEEEAQESQCEDTRVLPLSLEFLNKCLLQQMPLDWTQEANSPVLHISMMMEKFPRIPKAVDLDGRIPLHHAAEGGCFDVVNILFEEHPRGVSVVDPVSRLYPFMLAGSNENIDSSFKLLLADPSLVGSALLGDEGKKRKRRPSLDDLEYWIRREK